MLHLLWGKAQSNPATYVKQEWVTLQAELENLSGACQDALTLLQVTMRPWQLPASAHPVIEKLRAALIPYTKEATDVCTPGRTPHDQRVPAEGDSAPDCAG